jgi:hypothetical protein
MAVIINHAYGSSTDWYEVDIQPDTHDDHEDDDAEHVKDSGRKSHTNTSNL